MSILTPVDPVAISARLTAIRARLTATSPGPWEWWDIKNGGESMGVLGNDLVAWGGRGILPNDRDYGLGHSDDELNADAAVLFWPEGSAVLPNAEDATFIANAPDDMYWLLGLVERLMWQRNTPITR